MKFICLNLRLKLTLKLRVSTSDVFPCFDDNCCNLSSDLQQRKTSISKTMLNSTQCLISSFCLVPSSLSWPNSPVYVRIASLMVTLRPSWWCKSWKLKKRRKKPTKISRKEWWRQRGSSRRVRILRTKSVCSMSSRKFRQKLLNKRQKWLKLTKILKNKLML